MQEPDPVSKPDPSAPTIHIDTPEALKRWCAELNVPAEALETAVKAVGPRLDKVKDYLTAGGAGSQQGG